MARATLVIDGNEIFLLTANQNCLLLYHQFDSCGDAAFGFYYFAGKSEYARSAWTR